MFNLEKTPFGFVTKGDKATRRFSLEYRHNGSMWGVNFYAEDWADAEAKLQSMKDTLVLCGELDTVIEWNPETGESKTVFESRSDN